MPPYSNTTTTMSHRRTAVSQSSITSIHPDIIESHILNRLDGKSLASASSVSTELKSLCNGENLWKDVCNNTWPSSLDPLVQTNIESHRLFLSDASSSLNYLHPTLPHQTPKTTNLISAVDIFYEDKVILSKVILSESSSSWFSCSPFKIDILEHKEVFPTAEKIVGDSVKFMKSLEKSLKLNWILIDGDSRRAFNFSSMCPVSVRRHWLSGEIQIRFAMVVPGRRGGRGGEALVQCGVVVSCREDEEMQVKDISLTVEDNEGLILDGNEGLEIVQQVINGERRKKDSNEERERYEKFVKLKAELSERKQRKEKRLDMIVVFTGVSVFLSLCMLLLSR